MSGSRLLRVCPVGGCRSLPLKHLEKHLENVHADLTPEQTERLLRAASVFRVPTGKTRKEVAVRRIGGKRTRLQLAKKSTGGFSAAPREPTAAAESMEGVGLAGSRGRPPKIMISRGTQCNLLPHEILQSFHEPAGSAHQHPLPTTHPVRPQFARKSMCGPSVCTGGGGLAERRGGEEAVAVDSSERESPVGEPCEIVAKWGNWDVIFYETPSSLQPVTAPVPSTHSTTTCHVL